LKSSNSIAAERPAPSTREQIEIAAAAKRQLARTRPVEVGFDGGATDATVESPHSDPAGWAARLLDTLGTDSTDFTSFSVWALALSGRERGSSTDKAKGAINAGLAMVAAVAAENELEAALAIQMAGVHSLACDMLGRARHADRPDLIALYGGLGVKLTRTYAAQMEALAKIRGGGKQQVEVRHVHVNGNAVIGDVHGGGGGALESANQPHAKGTMLVNPTMKS